MLMSIMGNAARRARASTSNRNLILSSSSPPKVVAPCRHGDKSRISGGMQGGRSDEIAVLDDGTASRALVDARHADVAAATPVDARRRAVLGLAGGYPRGRASDGEPMRLGTRSMADGSRQERDPGSAPTTVGVVDFPLSTLSLDEHVGLLIERARAGAGLRVVTLNIEMVARATSDPAYAALIRCADLFVADGMPLVWLSRLAEGGGVCGRTNGTDLVQRLLTDQRAVAIGLLGGLDPRRMLDRLMVPPGRVVFIDSGRVDASEATLRPLSARIAAAGTQLLLVGLGVPKQDEVCTVLRRLQPRLVVVAVGGAFDLLAGLKPRAPGWMQRAGLEWLQRLAAEPHRLAGRYLLLYPRAIRPILRWALRQR
ncbi:MAG: WecB/TagA/CpsF family glycosyltransferase [Dongiaceae bacterium]